MMKYTIVIFLFSLSAMISANEQSDTCLNYMDLGITIPLSVRTEEQRYSAKKHLDFLGVKKIRFDESWEWRELERGSFNWPPLDDRMNWAIDNGFEIFLTIQSYGPKWRCTSLINDYSCVFVDNDDFRVYIDSLLQRYSNKISKIQFGTEWQTEYWYIGSANDFIQANNILYSSVQKYSPATKVVLGGFTTVSIRMMAACNGYMDSLRTVEGVWLDSATILENCKSPGVQNLFNRIDSVLHFAQYDILDLHLYDDVEQWDKYYKYFIDTFTKPVIVSEFGGPNIDYEPHSDTYQADRVFQYIKKLDSLRIPEGYFFKLLEGSTVPAHATSGLLDSATFLEKPSYYVFKSFRSGNNGIINAKHGKQLKFNVSPAKNFMTIEFKNTNQDYVKTISIVNCLGKLVKKFNSIHTDHYVLRNGNLSPGAYVVTVRDQTGVVAIRKMFVD